MEHEYEFIAGLTRRITGEWRLLTPSNIFFAVLLTAFLAIPLRLIGQSPSGDRLVDVGGYRLHLKCIAAWSIRCWRSVQPIDW